VRVATRLVPRDFFFPRENERGLDDREDQLFAASFHAQLGKGESVTIVCSTEKDASLDGPGALKNELKRQRQSAIHCGKNCCGVTQAKRALRGFRSSSWPPINFSLNGPCRAGLRVKPSSLAITGSAIGDATR